MSFEEEINEASKDMGGSDFWKLKEGDNRIRILTEPMIQVSRFGYGICYKGAPYCDSEQLKEEYIAARAKAKAEGKSNEEINKIKPVSLTKKWMCWAIARARKEGDPDEIVLVTLPYGVSKTLMEMKSSEEAGFDGWPMPYDINIKAKNAGKKEVEYQVIPSRKETPVTDQEREALDGKNSVEQILDRMKQKAKEKTEGTTSGSAPRYDSDEADEMADNIPF